MKPVSDVAEYPSLHERRNCVPLRLGDVGVMLRECSMLNGPLQVLATSRLEIKQIKHEYIIFAVTRFCSLDQI